MTSAENHASLAAGRLRFGEFVALVAAIMAVNAIGVDAMLPALTTMATDLRVANENDIQLVVLFYTGGFGVGQLFYGPLADRFGRRPVLLGALSFYVVMGLVAAHAPTFELMLAARLLQGVSAASSRVLSVSIVRDCYAGRTMARVMSLVFMVFLAVPIIAPTLGSLIMTFAPWHGIFYGLAAFGAFVALWVAVRLPETLHPEYRMAIEPRVIARSALRVVGNRLSIGYTVASGCVYGGLMGFISSSQQIFEHVFHALPLFPICFAAMAGMMGCAALLNSRIVERVGTRFVSHSALLAVIGLSAVRSLIVWAGYESLPLFVVVQGLTMFGFGLMGSNFGSMAMEPMGEIAGTAASVQGFISTLLGTGVGWLIGQAFAGSTLPLAVGFLLASITSLSIVLFAERGRLFRAHHAAAPKS
jgi:DHA1 family bicyclomycin/chloramphenicol resistance-like MFS transporter